MIQQRNPVLPFAVQCALLFLAVTVFGWGLQGKLAQYSESAGQLTRSANHAKLTTDDRPLQAQPSQAVILPELAIGHLRLASRTAEHGVATAAFSRPERGPRTPGRYNLHRADGLHRPPPSLT